MNEELQQWIAAARKAGLSRSEIKRRLLAHGWNTKDIDENLPKTTNNKQKLIGLSFAVFVSLLLTCVIYLVPIRFTDNGSKTSDSVGAESDNRKDVAITKIEKSSFTFGIPFVFQFGNSNECKTNALIIDKVNNKTYSVDPSDVYTNKLNLPQHNGPVNMFYGGGRYNCGGISNETTVYKSYALLFIDFCIFMALFAGVFLIGKYRNYILLIIFVVIVISFFTPINLLTHTQSEGVFMRIYHSAPLILFKFQF